MGCLGECWEVGPPPDTILNLPPPPLPAFFQHAVPDLLVNTTPCFSTQLCESFASNNILESGDYVELPRKEIESWSITGIDDTWLLVLVASSIGVLLLGALLAMFLLKCREMSMFEDNECSNLSRDHRQIKNHHHHHEPRECTSVTNLSNGTNKFVHPSETVLYHGGSNVSDNRMVWATLTPRGTQHFVSESYHPRDMIDYNENDDHYETIDNLNGIPSNSNVYHQYHHHKGLTNLKIVGGEKSSFDNSGFVDYYDYEDPTPLIESYQLNDMENNRDQVAPTHYTMLGNPDMRCASLNLSGHILKQRGVVPIRPRVSSPTRIENPNLPPLNLYPHKTNTLKRTNNTLTYRNVDTGTLPKYGY